MPRQPRQYLGHVYQPTPRRAYGRRPGSHPLVEEATAPRATTPARLAVVTVADLRADPALIGRVQWVPVPMPRGGWRWLVTCPVCAGRVDRLYRWTTPEWASLPGLCRACWGLRYASQYTGRRPEADAGRVAAVRHAARRTRDPAARARRSARARDAAGWRLLRNARQDARAGVAFSLAVLPSMLRFDARLHRLCRPVGDSPDVDGQDGDGPPVVGDAFLSVATLEELRARYRAGTRPRRSRRAT